ncbi:MAG: glycosyltransferase [Candidatus Competibacteraceae bacterium]|jgi:GT2 family glycosyltransferase|nr:glycosyltransferase [Candidatus Competibacteraceae bacterium]
MERIRLDGMFFSEGDRRFWLRGVSYGPFRATEAGEFLPENTVVTRDLALIRELGANTLRLYHPPPPWFIDLTAAAGLRLLVGLPWAQHIRFLDGSQIQDNIRQSVRRAAQNLRDAPTVLGLLIGNEISPQILRWYGPQRVKRFLAELADETRQAAPETLVSYGNFPMTEYLELDFLDFVSFNVYLHDNAALSNYLARLQNLANFKPLVLSEFGADSLRESEPEQARIVGDAADVTAQLGLAGAVAFAFTDEWHTGGHDIQDWCFGVVTLERQPKPAFQALQRVFQAPYPPFLEPTPRASVVICAYNAEATLHSCLESLRKLRYPNYEVLVINDGSTDGTQAIAQLFPEFRLISHENRGLSAARNTGTLAATSKIVAFTDADCEVDPDWLTFLVRRLLSEDFAAVGGPNLPPREEHWVPEVVARSPGGPTHVLLTDHEAEHIPGCNMAFWRSALVEVGHFDPTFRTAGDDVDICWRLQDSGYRIGFAAAALVWHRRRSTVSAYLTQQRGYGHAEGLLAFKHPRRFNSNGQSRWLGRIYTGSWATGFIQKSVIYGGPFGNGLFQTLYEPPDPALRHLPGTLEWNALALLLLVLAGVTQLFGGSFAELGWLGAGLAVGSVTWAILLSFVPDIRDIPAPPWKVRPLIATLTYLGPLLRAIERYRTRVAGLRRAARFPMLDTGQPSPLAWYRRAFELSFWNETSIEKETCISTLIDYLRLRQYIIVLDDGWQPWDFLVKSGIWARAEVKLLVQNHGERRRQLDIGVRVRRTGLAQLLTTGMLLVTGSAAFGGLSGIAAIFAGLLACSEGFVIRQRHQLARTLYHATENATRSLPLRPHRSGP